MGHEYISQEEGQVAGVHERLSTANQQNAKFGISLIRFRTPATHSGILIFVHRQVLHRMRVAAARQTMNRRGLPSHLRRVQIKSENQPGTSRPALFPSRLRRKGHIDRVAEDSADVDLHQLIAGGQSSRYGYVDLINAHKRRGQTRVQNVAGYSADCDYWLGGR